MKDGSIVLTLADLLNPSNIDLEHAVHETVHALFATMPTDVQAGIHRAVQRLFAEMDPGAREVIEGRTGSVDATRDVLELAEERLANLL